MSMRVNDLAVADAEYVCDNNIDAQIAKLHYPLKYLRLMLGQSIIDLKIVDVKEHEIFLKPTYKVDMDITALKYLNNDDKLVDYKTIVKETLDE